ncbi:hypothetical protein A1O3_08028 [Capronia epimyces CBS 606.96]|uniref:CorA-like transporter domain-containing protein n=1 Tax=Capronia epimyces CBS 606.96 TaxID=1182542 RepID=W9XQX9_9EURO|nr:uncharacterized protein A1O3_08028 [Capronia epimyces CBS 606.96]EXJ79745.1 hypothetical protein A1O3_08028 [Capronia epimyces CBS 606.96]
MQALQLPTVFQQSYLNSESYPQNLFYKSTLTYRTALQAFKDRLDAVAPDLFVNDESKVEVSFRDLQNDSGRALEKWNIHTASKLTDWLGLETVTDPADATKLVIVARKADPKSRFIYVYGEHSRAPLKITRDMLAQILTFHQVMPIYLDFISVFGAQSEPRDRRFSGFREQSTLSDPPRGLAIPSLGRSGRQYQLCYNLKSVALVSKDATNPRFHEWSIRPAVIHHQFDIVTGTSLWIVTKGNRDLHERYKELTGNEARPEDRSFGTVGECLRSSLAAHLMFCHWSTENWRWYMLWLETVIEEETSMVILGARGPGHSYHRSKPEHVQHLQLWEDKTNEVIMVLEANVDIMKSLCRFYDGLRSNKDVPQSLKDECGLDIVTFIGQIEDMSSDFKMQIARAKLLVKITNDRKEMVIQHLQSQATERMERLNQNMEKEAIVMRIITLVTLVYLPATFVSVSHNALPVLRTPDRRLTRGRGNQTFFSTDIIKYQNQNGGPPTDGTFSKTAMYRWLQVTLPLTLATMGAAIVSLKLTERRRQQQQRPAGYKLWKKWARSKADEVELSKLFSRRSSDSVV